MTARHGVAAPAAARADRRISKLPAAKTVRAHLKQPAARAPASQESDDEGDNTDEQQTEIMRTMTTMMQVRERPNHSKIAAMLDGSSPLTSGARISVRAHDGGCCDLQADEDDDDGMHQLQTQLTKLMNAKVPRSRSIS